MEKKKSLVDRIYERALEDPILIPLTWRIWIALGFAVYIFGVMVLYPLSVCLFVVHKFENFFLIVMSVGSLATLICLRAAFKAMRRPRGRGWNKWLRKKDIESSCELKSKD